MHALRKVRLWKVASWLRIREIVIGCNHHLDGKPANREHTDNHEDKPGDPFLAAPTFGACAAPQSIQHAHVEYADQY